MPIDDHDLGNLPDQITPGDADTNDSTTFVLTRLQAWTGAAWQRVRSGAQSAANSVAVALAPDQSTSFDLDTGGGTQQALGVSLRKAASGGSVELGTPSDPIRCDPTGTTTQPISGTVAVSSLPSIPTGSNTIGAVTAPGAAALALDGTLTGGTQKAIVRGAAKGATVAADGTTTAQGADHTGLDVQVRDVSGNPFPSADVAARKLFAAVTDGTNTQAVKAASTAAGAADPSAVVALSPNSSVPTGSNTIGAVTAPGAVALATAALQGTTFDLDTGAGTQAVSGVSLRQSASGGSVELGTATDPLRVDPTGTTRQPVDHGATYTTALSTALEGSRVAKTAAGTLYAVTAWVDASAAKGVFYLQLFNATALPANGTAVTYHAPIPIDHQNGSYEILTVDKGQGGIAFSTGLVAALSTTPFTLTVAGAVAAFQVEYA